MRLLASFAMLAGLVAIQGCGTSTPPCADEKTVGLVKKIFRKSLGDELASKGQDASLADQIANAIQLNVTTIRTSGNDEKVKKFTCDAVLEATLPEKAGKMVNLPLFRAAMAQDLTTHGIEVSGSTIKHDVQYTSQVTDDSKEHLVELRGHKPIVEVAIALGTIGAFKADQTGASDKQASATAPKPEALPDLSKYLGQHPTEVFKEPLVMQKFKSLLGKDYDDFFDSLSTSTELELKGDYYFGSGCAPHACSIAEAAFVVHKPSGNVLAAQLIEGKEIKSFGVSSGSNLPGPLRDWYKEHGGPN